MAALIDESVIQQMTDDLGKDTCLMLINLFIEEMTDLHTKLVTAFSDMDAMTIADITHIVKNSAALYGAMALSAKATEINNQLTILNQAIATSDTTILPLMENTLLQYNEQYNKK